MRWSDVYRAPLPPDRVERLLSSCRAYYRAGDTDIVLLLLRELEKELAAPGGVFAAARDER